MPRPGAARRFRNPVLSGFHPDPSLCRVGDDFYLVTSSFEYFPGVPIFHTKDLVNYRQLGHVLTRRSQLDLTGQRSSGGIYAPTLRYHAGRFYLVTTLIGRGNFYVTAERPEGPWSDPIWLDRDGIDPSFAFLDGTTYYTRNGKGPDFDHPLIYQGTLEPKSEKLSVIPEPIWPGTGGVWAEAPHLFKRGDYYYLIHAEGGTGYDHSQIAVRSKSPFGPFEACPYGPILGHRERPNHPIQATGHADFVDLPNGDTWAVFLAIRPKGGRYHHLGRETFLARVTWTRDGWPIVGKGGHVELEMDAPPLPSSPFPAPKVRDDFDATALDHCWQYVGNPDTKDVSLTARRGFLRLSGSPVTLAETGSPSAIVRRQEHFAFRARTRLEFDPTGEGEEAGLVVRGNEAFHYTLTVRRAASGRDALLCARVNGETKVVRSVPVAPGPVELAIAGSDDAYAFAVDAGGRRSELGRLPTRELSIESMHKKSGVLHFTGACLGPYATGNGRRSSAPADFDWFEYAPGQP